MIQLQLFGPPNIRAGDAELRAVLAQPKRFALLVYLTLAEPKGAHRRDELLALFWPDRPEDAARAALSRATHFLRHSLGAELVVGRTAEELGVDQTLLASDVLEFDRVRATGDLAAAMALYRGDLLPGFYADDAPEFMRWLDETRARLREAAAKCALQLAARAATAGAFEEAVSWSARAQQLAPYDEQVLQQRLRALIASGDRSGALLAYAAFATRLEADLETEPARETTQMVEAIRRGSAATTATIAPGMFSDGAGANTSWNTESPPGRILSFGSSAEGASDTLGAAVAVPTRTDGGSEAPRRDQRARWALVGAGAMLVIAAGALAWRPWADTGDHSSLSHKVQLTRSNHVGFPTISPDGKQLAYLEQRCEGTACGFVLVVQDVGGLATRVLTDSIVGPRELRWSPDRRTLVFYGRHGTRTGTWLQDLMGGAPRRVGDGPAAFFADGDSLLIAPTFHADSTHVLHVVSRDGAVHDSIVLRVPGGGISVLLAMQGSPYFIALVDRPPRGWWQVFDRTGRLVDHVENACICGGHASDDALWLSRPAGPDGKAVVRLAFDRSSGHLSAQQDTIIKGLFSSFAVTADGRRLVADIGQLETSVWLPTVHELFDGALPDDRRIEHASQGMEWELSPDGARLLITRTVAAGTSAVRRASIRPTDGGPETPVAIPGNLVSVQWADSVTVEFRARDAGDTLVFGLADARDGAVRERFVSGERAVWASTRIAEGWAWVLPGGKRVRVMQRGVRHEWPVPRWFEQVYGIRGGTGVRVPFVLGGRVSGDSMAVAALDISTGHFDFWFRRKSEGESGMQSLGEGRVIVRTTRQWPFFDYTLLTGPTSATLVGAAKHPNLRASFSNDLKRVVAVEYRYNADAWLYEVRRR